LLALIVVPMIAAYIAAVATLGMGTDGAWLRLVYTIVVIAIMLAQAIDLLAGEAPAPTHRQPDYDDLLREEPRMHDEK
jgi:hypothetical protein